MADQKISALTEVTAPTSSDVVPIVNAATTKKVQIANLVKLGNVAIWARAFHNANQSISNATPTAVSLNSERADTDTIHDNATNNSRLTCKTAGIYMISFTALFDANATGWRFFSIRLNGTTTLADTRAQAITVASIGTGGEVSTLYALAVNDYVEAVVQQTSGGALNLLSVGNSTPELMMIRLGA